jgi:hypothetical protein
MYERRHFKEIGLVISQLDLSEQDKEKVIYAFCMMFKESNPSFKTDRFRDFIIMNSP